MLAEIARKRDDAERARDDEVRRQRETRSETGEAKQADPGTR
jgi:hypothetical protein